jgi:hypothetical protein
MTTEIRKSCLKKNRYHTLLDAVMGVLFYRFSNGTELMPYRCRHCPGYHLTRGKIMADHPSKIEALLSIEAQLLALTGAGKAKGRSLEGATYWTYSLDGAPLADVEAGTWQEIRDRLISDLPCGEYGIEYVQFCFGADWEPQEVFRFGDFVEVEELWTSDDEYRFQISNNF